MKLLKKILLPTCLSVAIYLPFSAVLAETVTAKAVMTHYTDMAHAAFSDSLASTRTLKGRIDALVATPSEETLQAAKAAWLAARIPYGQTEVFRFGNANVDAWEGKVNAWPLDEGLIDYVVPAYEYEDGNAFAKANIIAGKETINTALLASYHEKGGSEANVATGYHAIEFLLWGQDLNKNPEDSGTRPYTDYAKGTACTNGHCERRADYLRAATDLLITDLQTMVNDWEAGKDNYRKTFLALPEKEALRRILFGMGSLSLGELAGERINVALLAHSQEDEHSCFSDNTHADIAENARGIQNVFQGRYQRIDGSQLNGASLAELVALQDSKLSQALQEKLAESQAKAEAVSKAAENGEHFDQQIIAGNEAGNQRVRAVIKALRAQTVSIEAISEALNINSLTPETSDSFGG